jgi:NAD(P) transhydrogenase subunit alpha
METVLQFISTIGHADITADPSFLITAITVFVLASFLGYYIVWSVTPTLHSPLMSITNAISSIIIIGALIAAERADTWWGFFAIIFATINIFGGFVVTDRMLSMFKDKKATVKEDKK